jgi:outer membrane receptor protein involved in Fe transport
MATSVLTGLVAIASPAWAQEAGPTTVEEVVVTGSRIPRPNLDQPTPVATLSAETIEDAGTQDLGEILSELPQMSSNSTVRANAGALNPGLTFPNLRGLGAVRTLTLVDGRRHVGGSAGATSVDLNSIPASLVERTEIITGGASAIYGSDAVTGVVNIILKDDFEGFEFGGEIGGPSEIDQGGGSKSAYLTVGGNFNEGRGNAVFSFNWNTSDILQGNDVPALDNYGTINNPADGDPNDPFDPAIENNGIPDSLIVPRVGSEFISRFGAATPDGVNNFGFDANGNPFRVPQRTGENSFAFGQLPPCDTCYFSDDDLVVLPDLERMVFNTRARYDFSDNLTFKIDAKYVTLEAEESVQPSFSFFTDIISLQDTPFLTPAAKAFFANEGVDFAFVSRMMYDIADGRRSSVNRDTWRITPSLEGRFDAPFAEVRWEAFYNAGETTNKNDLGGLLLSGNYLNAIDAVINPVTGQIDCRSNVPSAQGAGYTPPTGITPETCVPYNPFGEQNSQTALDYVSTPAVLGEVLTQDQAAVTFSFDTERFFNLPGGPIGIAGGLEWREEYSVATTDAIIQAGLTEFAPQPDAPGGFDVSEAFIEFSAPLLAGAPFAHRLEIDGAFRTADYSHAGRAEAWKLGLIYAPIRSLTFRGTYAEAVRAPNITEAFLPQTPGFTSIQDPCDEDRVGNDPDRAANCLAAGVPANFQSNTNVTIDSEAGGNPNLESESAETFTIGAIYQPEWFEGLSMTVDYYDIEITDAIVLPAAQAILDNCYDSSAGLDPTFCAQFTRGPDNNINFLSQTYLNASKIQTSGVDFQVAYRREIASLTQDTFLAPLNGDISMSLNGNYLEKFRVFQFQANPLDENFNEGEVGNPELSLVTNVTYRQGPLRVSWSSRYEGEGLLYEATPFNEDGSINGSCEDISPCRIEAVWYHDLVARYQVPMVDGVEVYAGVNNVFDEQFPIGLVGTGVDGSAAYDILGRYFFTGVRVKF